MKDNPLGAQLMGGVFGGMPGMNMQGGGAPQANLPIQVLMLIKITVLTILKKDYKKN